MRTLIDAWEAVQVELHGQYSTRRLLDLRRYSKSTSIRQAILVLLLTPLPCLCVLIGIDALPVVSPEEGAYRQTTGLWVRTLYSGWSMAFFLNVQLCQIEPSLPMSTRRLWTISISISLLLVATYHVEVWAIGFPVPFTLQVQSIPFTIALGTAWWFSWKGFLLANPVAKDNVIRYLKLFNNSNMSVAGYIVYILVYKQLDGWNQLAFSALLPVVKLIGKNITSASLHHQEDLAPVIMVSIVDVFHTLFVSMTMQQTSTSITTTCLFVLIDIVQSTIAIYDVRQILTRLKELDDQIKRLDRGYSPSNSEGLVSSVARILETSPTVHQHPAIALPRHLRNPAQPRASLIDRLLSITRPSLAVVQPHGQHPAIALPRDPAQPRPSLYDRLLSTTGPSLVVVEPLGPTSPPVADALPLKPLSKLESAQVEYAQKVLKLLHMTESYVLLEFVEAMITTIYGTYAFAMSYMPNRVYYPNFAALSPTQLRTAAAQVAVYASLEVLSLAVFLWVLGNHIRGLSPLRQLAFVLHTHWKLIQSLCVILVHVVAQIAFVHNGCDFTFRFEWLKRGSTSGST